MYQFDSLAVTPSLLGLWAKIECICSDDSHRSHGLGHSHMCGRGGLRVTFNLANFHNRSAEIKSIKACSFAPPLQLKKLSFRPCSRAQTP